MHFHTAVNPIAYEVMQGGPLGQQDAALFTDNANWYSPCPSQI